MMETKKKSEGQIRREKAVARLRSNEPSREKNKKLGKTSKGLVYEGPVQVLNNLFGKPGILRYSRLPENNL